jgi:hypothetical protein
MDIAQAQQEIARLRGLYESRQLTPEAFAQAVSQLQIQDASGIYWHVDGASLRWYRYTGQNWVEGAAPLPPVPPPPAPRAWTPASYAAPTTNLAAMRKGAKPSRLPLWIGLGALLVILAAAAGAYLGGAFQPGALLALGASATPNAPSATPTAAITATPARTATAAAATAAPSATQSVTRTSAPSSTAAVKATLAPAAVYLPANGPWLISRDNNNLYLVGANQTSKLNTDWLMAPSSLSAMIAPKGSLLAFVTATDPGKLSGLKLNIYNLAAQKLEKTIALTSPKTEPGIANMPGDAVFEAARSIIEFDSLAWSPDGRKLAFIGVQDGPSSDLYVYSLDTQKVTRLTDGPSQGFAPSWSPDGKYIVQFGATTFGTGAGISMAGAWATPADGGASISLFPISGSSGETTLGWANANTALIYSWNPICGSNNLRAVSLQPLKVTAVVAGCFNDAAFDPASGSIVVGITQDLANFSGSGKKVDSGLYLGKLDGGLKRLNTGDFDAVAYLSNAGAVWGHMINQNSIAYSLAGKAMSLPSGMSVVAPQVAAGGKAWAWTAGTVEKKPGVWIGAPDGSVGKISDLPVSAAIWSKDGSALLFLSGTKLYAAAGPDYQAVALGATSTAHALAWVDK